jgi:hypothetical protein
MAKITAPQQGFSGRSVGVQFDDGIGETDNPSLIAYFRRHGYLVEGSSEELGVEEQGSTEVVDPLGEQVVDRDLGKTRDAADPRNDTVPVGGVKGDGTIVAGPNKGKRVRGTQKAPVPEPGSVSAPVQESADPTFQSANPSTPNPPEAVTPTEVPAPIDGEPEGTQTADLPVADSQKTEQVADPSTTELGKPSDSKEA